MIAGQEVAFFCLNPFFKGLDGYHQAAVTRKMLRITMAKNGMRSSTSTLITSVISESISSPGRASSRTLDLTALNRSDAYTFYNEPKSRLFL